MTPAAFITKWRAAELKERSAAQSRFNGLCRLLDLPDPVTADPTGVWFTFEKGAAKSTGGQGWADVWRKHAFAWKYKGKHRNLDAAHTQLLRYAVALENPPLLIVSDMDRIVIRTNWTNTVLLDATRRNLLCATSDKTLAAGCKKNTPGALTSDAVRTLLVLGGSLLLQKPPFGWVKTLIWKKPSGLCASGCNYRFRRLSKASGELGCSALLRKLQSETQI